MVIDSAGEVQPIASSKQIVSRAQLCEFLCMYLSKVLCLVAVTCCLDAAEAARRPRHDPPGQPFRRAPMAQASRSIVINLGSNLHLAFDADLCRVHTVWIGGPLNLWGPPYSGAKSPFICDFEGRPIYTFPQLPPSPGLPARFEEISLTNGAVSVAYTFGQVRVREHFTGAVRGDDWEFTRHFTVTRGSPLPHKLLLFADAHAQATPANGKVQIVQTNGTFEITASGVGDLRVVKEEANYTTELITEEGTEKGDPIIKHSGPETRVYLHFPKLAEGSDFQVRFASRPKPVPHTPPVFEKSRTFVSTTRPRRNSGDEFYSIEHFPLPAEAELIITGMDTLPNGDLVLCTWLGDVFIVEGATAAPAAAKYKRIARGLNEPLGIAVRGDDLFVVQKGELTQLIDSDSDGAIDRIKCINADWGYSGNYHSYSFGPVLTPEGDMFVFITGQRGRADLLYQGWALKIRNGSTVGTPWCDGLRVPHGVGLFQGDLFVTDNQGNWIGACRLNHILPGRFYGFPSSRPSPPGPRRPEEVTPPALWFPRSLAPSTSGFDTISDARFGPFQGQMLIGDFQNAIVMRAFLEKVNGTWQGAVFPFAKGFLSGVNRLKMNRDGKLYVGGGKRTWSTAAPLESSLDRVSFTGKLPFEVKAALAEVNGFTLVFTKPFDREIAADPENYLVKQFTYKYHADYGSPEFDHTGNAGATELKVTEAALDASGTKVRLTVPGLKTGFVTAFQLAVTSAEDEDLRHDAFYYTLNQQPAPQ